MRERPGRLWLLIFAGYMAVPLTSAAHHSIAAVYDSSKRVAIDGVITQFRFVNPHPYLTVDVAGADGAEPWHLELDNRVELAAIGMTAETLKPGDRVAVSGSPSRTEPHSLYVRTLTRPADGFAYEQVGTSPVIRR